MRSRFVSGWVVPTGQPSHLTRALSTMSELYGDDAPVMKFTLYGYIPKQKCLKLAVVVSLLIFNMKIGVANAQVAPPELERLTITGAVELSLKQNLDVQIANIQTAMRQQDRVIARSDLL